jgi:hemerythrin
MPTEWDSEYGTGVEDIDAQHREINSRMRWLGEAIGAERTERIGPELGALALLLTAHFRGEERWMRETGYAGLAEHARAHRACADSMDRALRAYEAAGVTPHFLDVIERVARWLDIHLRAEDLRFGRFAAGAAAKRSGPVAAPRPGGSIPSAPKGDGARGPP